MSVGNVNPTMHANKVLHHMRSTHPSAASLETASAFAVADLWHAAPKWGCIQGDMFIIHASIALQFFFSRQGDEVVCCHTQCKLLGQEVGEGVASSLRSVLVLRSGYNTCNCPLRSLQVRGGAGIQVWHTWHLCYDLDDGGWSCNNQTYQTKILMPPWSDV